MIAGMDGTKKGWVLLSAQDDLSHLHASLVKDIAEVPRTHTVVAIDIPIGLPERGAREADLEARRILKERRSCVFPCLVRPTLKAVSYEDACDLTEQADGRRISKQAYGLLPKIKEVDRYLQRSSWARETFHEVHPEVSFFHWNGGRNLKAAKKTQLGKEERQALIAKRFGSGLFRKLKDVLYGDGITDDDLADAFAALWTAQRILSGEAQCLPQREQHDSQGLPMRMWA